MRQADRRYARSVAVQQVDFKDSEHNFVHATVRLPGRFAPNRRTRDISDGTPVRIDPQQLVADSKLQTSFQVRTFFRPALTC